MKSFIIFLLVNLVGISPCEEEHISEKLNGCITSQFNRNVSYNDMVAGIPNEVVIKLVKRPDENGALGRNRSGYFHVRFQFDMPRLTDYAIKFQNTEALSEYLRNLKYSFLHQKSKGDFQFNVPDDLLEEPNFKSPSEANLASGTAFFAYSLGLSLNSLKQSDWYKNSPSTTSERNEIKSLNPRIGLLLEYLKRSVGLLNIVDEKAPNRLLFNAYAFYSLGKYLDDEEAKNIGIDFVKRALRQRNQMQGYFIEGGGWDSSYNGVAIKLGFELFTLISNNSHDVIKDEIEKAISCAVDWQKSRILETGEISTNGNRRVFPKGETFLGKEKEVDVVKTLKAFFYMNVLSDKKEYGVLAQRVIEHYE